MEQIIPLTSGGQGRAAVREDIVSIVDGTNLFEARNALDIVLPLNQDDFSLGNNSLGPWAILLPANYGLSSTRLVSPTERVPVHRIAAPRPDLRTDHGH
jgi:hypothetical protein